MSDDTFSIKETVIRIEGKLDGYILESKARDDKQDTEIRNLGESVVKIKTETKIYSSVTGMLAGLLSSFGHGFFK